jgi:uncharacterized protein YyaL (SSP411 family)
LVTLRRAARATVALTRHGRLTDHLRRAPAPADASALARHLIDWMRRAFAASADGGVSAAYDLAFGWDAPYPEVTGYYIPTLLDAARVFGADPLRDLAFQAGAWLAQTRLTSGAIVRKQWQPSNITPSVFNTGQVIDGWCALAAATKDQQWVDLARSAGDWLIAEQETDGRWVRSAYNGIAHSYYTRVAWPLARVTTVSGDPRYAAAARRQLDWVLTQQSANGWIDAAGFDAAESPTTHTIAYVLEGLLGAGEVLGEEKYIAAAERGARALRDIYATRSRGLPGRFARGWRARAGWRCLTGDAQTALVWQRLAARSGDALYHDAALRMIDDLRVTVRIQPSWPEVSGAVQGSYPVWGGYDPYRYPAHAVKYTLDLLMAVGVS